ncbi:MAG TPA: lipoyl synthase [Acidimicrobiales bacterium]|jgi:lipoic acid synthetase|nr:lipoyl synthase [Acidimicrobiales bacterium]
MTVRVRLLGRVPYAEALDLQRALQRSRDDYVVVLEHPAVYTAGARTDPANLLVPVDQLGAELVAVDRGGDVTFHGPGQVVCYPIVTLGAHPGAGRAHVELLEDAVIEVVAAALPDAARADVGRLEGHPGVWVTGPGRRPAKVAAVGIRTTRLDDGRRRTLHGVALNVDVDLSWFARIVPCGIGAYPVTSLRALGADVDVDEVADRLAAAVARRLADHGDVDRAAVDRGTVAQGAAPVGVRRLRHAGVDTDRAIALATRKPSWLRIPAQMGDGFLSLKQLTKDLSLVTVCEEAGCPNIFECWADGTATFMVNGDRCTRACGFCLVDTRRPLPLDPTEPARVAEAVDRLGLAHAVVTCVARDDLHDGGAGALARCVEEIRARTPSCAVEVLTSDLRGDREALTTLLDARPDVLNHNVETVARLQHAVRPSAGYARSLTVLARAADAGLVVKSGLMLGLGETFDEVVSTLADLAAVGVRTATVGQYLRPSAAHLPVARYWAPEEFDAVAEAGRALGLAHVQASPLTRSSYHAREAHAASVPVALRAAR